MACAGSGLGAGPATTEPSVIANSLPWHGQLIVPFSTVDTAHPWWVQIAENALNVPALGWVITNWASVRMTPPPTGTSAVAASLPPAVSAAPGWAGGAGAGAGWAGP